MNNRNSLMNVISRLGCCCGLLFSVSGWPQDSEAARMEKSGREAFEAGHYRQALEFYAESAARAEDPAARARIDFRQAVTLQQMAVTATPEDAAVALRRAASLYQSYLEQNPGASSAANNLAKVYETAGLAAKQAGNAEQASGYFGRADGFYRQAIGSDDASRGLYLKNYAEFLERTGQWALAKETYASLIEAYPVAPELQQSLAASYREHGLADLAEYLWNLQDAGYAAQSAGFALDALQQTANVNDVERIEFLTLLCTALAQSTDDRQDFADSDMGRRIGAIATDSFIGQGAAEIASLYRGERLQSDDFGWWSSDWGWRNVGSRIVPVEGFRALARSLGNRSKRAGEPQLAERYFLLAYDLGAWSGGDPVAIRDLARMYAENNEFGKIDALLNKYQVSIYEGKERAYRNSQVEKVFQYHQALGELYALIERWGDSHQVKSATFQLEHAKRASNILANQTDGKLPETYRFTPQMVEQLSTCYEKTGRLDESLQLRIDQANVYIKDQETQDAVRVLAPIKQLEIPPTLPDQYRSQLEIYNRDGLIELPKTDLDKVQLKNFNNRNQVKEIKDSNGR